MASGKTIATAWIKVLPSLEGLQAALVKASKGSVLEPKVRPAKGTESLFSASGSKLSNLFSTSFSASSDKSLRGAFSNVLSSVTSGFGSAGKKSGEVFVGGFSGFVGPQGISGYLKLGAAAAGITVLSKQVSGLVGSITHMGDAWAGVNARLQNAVGSTGDWHEALRKTEGAASAIGVSIEDLADQSARLVLLAPNTIPDYSTALKFTTLLNQNMIATGASAEEAAGATRQITQALGKGIVNGDELNSIMENSPQIAQMLAKHLGVGVGQLKEMGKAGQISGDALRDAVLENAQLIEDQFNKMPQTVSRSITAIKNSWKLNMSEAAVKSSEALGNAFKKLATDGYIKQISENLSGGMVSVFEHMGAAIGNVIDQVAPHIVNVFTPERIQPFVDGINQVSDKIALLDFDDINQKVRQFGLIASIAFLGAVGGVNGLLKHIPLVGPALIGVKNGLVKVGSAASAMSGASVSAFGKMISKVGDFTVKLSDIPAGLSKSKKRIADFRNEIQNMDFSKLPKSFDEALTKVVSGTGDIKKNIKTLDGVIAKLSENAKKDIPIGFGEAFGKVRESINETNTSFGSFTQNLKKNIGKSKSLIAEIAKDSVGINIKTQLDPKSEAIAVRQIRDSIGAKVGQLAGIPVPDFLTGPIGSMVATSVNFLNGFVNSAKAIGDTAIKAGNKIGVLIGKFKELGFMKNTVIPAFDQMGAAMKSAFDGVAEKIGSVAAKVKEKMTAIGTAIADTAKKIPAGLKSIPGEVKSVLYSAMNIPPEIQNKIDASLGKITGKFAKFGDGVKLRMKNAFEVAGLSVRKFGEKFGGAKQMAVIALNKIGAAALKLSGGALKGVGKSVSVMGSAFGKLGSMASRLGVTGAAMGAITAGFQQLWNADPAQLGAAFTSMGAQMERGLGKAAVQLPAMAKGFADALPGMVSSFNAALPSLMTAFGTVIQSLGTALTENMPAIMQGFNLMLKGLMESVPQALPGFVAGFVDLFTSIAANLPGMLGILGDGIVQMLNGLGPILSTALPQIMSSIGMLMENIGAHLPAFAEKLGSTLLGLVESLSAMLPTLLPKFLSGIAALVEGIVGSFPTLVPQLIKGVSYLLEGLVNALPGMLQVLLPMIPSIIDSLSQTLVESLPQLLAGVNQLLMALVQNLPSIMTTLIDALPSIITSIVDAIVTNLPILINGVMQLITSLAEQLPTLIGAIIDKLPELIMTLGGTILDNFPKIVKAFGDGFVTVASQLPTLIVVVLEAIPAILGKIAHAFISLGSKIADKISDIPDKIKGVFSGAGSWLVDAGKKIIQGLWNGMKKIWKDVTGWIGGLGNWIKDHKGPPSYDAVLLVNAGQLIMGGLNRGLQDGFKDVKSFIGTVNNELSGIGADIQTNVNAVGSSNIGLGSYAGIMSNGIRPVVQQNFPATIIREDDDIYTAYPKLQRIALNEAMMV